MSPFGKRHGPLFELHVHLIPNNVNKILFPLEFRGEMRNENVQGQENQNKAFAGIDRLHQIKYEVKKMIYLILKCSSVHLIILQFCKNMRRSQNAYII